ncbi:hypothetical protein ACNKHW_01520 [Shigella flexneri]
MNCRAPPVNAGLPKQPDPNDFFSDESLAKYDFDQNRALASFPAG